MTNFITEHANEIVMYISKAEKGSCYRIRCEFYNMEYPAIKINGWDDKKGISVDFYMSASEVEEWITKEDDLISKETFIVSILYNLVRQEEMRRNAVLMKMGEK